MVIYEKYILNFVLSYNFKYVPLNLVIMNMLIIKTFLGNKENIERLGFCNRKKHKKHSFAVTVSNKNTSLADFETCVFRVYLRNHLSYRKVIYIYLHSCLGAFR